MTSATVEVPSIPTLDANHQRARYGVSYLKNICAQAGVGLTESSPDEDVLAIDCGVEFAELSVRVQVKCTSSLTIGGRVKRVPIEVGWLEKWRRSVVPVYLVVVVVPRNVGTWIEHKGDGTMHMTAAFWARIDDSIAPPSVRIPSSQRLTSETLDLWHQDLLARFSPGGTR